MVLLAHLLHPVRTAIAAYRGWQEISLKTRQSLLWVLLMRQRKWFRMVIVFFVVSVALQLLIGNATVAMVDNGIVDQAIPLEPYVWHVVRLALLFLLASFAQRQVTARLSYHMEFELRTWLYTRVQSGELRRLDDVAAGQLVARSMTDLNLVENILRYFPTILGLAPVILGLLLFLLFLSPPMAFLAALALPLNLWLLSKFRVRLWGLSWAELNERAEVARAVDEPVRGIRVVKAFGREAFEQERLRGRAERTYRYSMTRTRLIARYDVLMKLSPMLISGLLIFVGVRLVDSDALTLGAFLIAFQIAASVTRIAQIFDELGSGWQYLRGAQARLGEMLALGSRPREGRPLPDRPEGLEVREIGMSFNGAPPVLRGFDLAVRPGELVVLTGPPRAGKSTVAALAAGLLEPSQGRVVLDGLDLGMIDETALRGTVRLVTEEPLLFAGTIRHNLDLGAAWRTSDRELLAACTAAGADDVLADLGGLDASVGDRGLTLSGGQRQRLALARALVARPRLLVLDDALSAVNPAREVEILDRIRSFAPEMAVLCITRRAGPTRLADRVVRLPDPVAATDLPFVAVAPDVAPSMPATTGPVGPRLAEVVSRLEVSDEDPAVGDADVVDGRTTVSQLLRLMPGLALAVLAVLTINTLGELGPDMLFGAATDAVEDEQVGTADLVALGVVLAGAVYAVSSYAYRVLVFKFSQSMVYLLRRRVFLRLTRLGIDYFDREMPGQVATRVVHDLDTILNFVQGTALRILTLIATFVIGLVTVVVIAPSTAPVVIAMGVALIAVTAWQFPIGIRAFDHARSQLGDVVTKFEEDFAGRAEIRGVGATAKATHRFVEAAWELRQRRRWATTVVNLYMEVVQFAANLLAVLVLWRAGRSVLAGAAAIGSALSVRLIAQQATQRLQAVADGYTRLLDLRVSWQRLGQPFEAPILPIERANAVECPPLRGEVVFDRVGFGYPHTGRQVLNDVSFAIEPGSVTAVVGYTGAGKSSIAKLLMRMYDPDVGEVRVDGYDLRDLDLRSYRARLGVVPQDAFVFGGTIATNIGYSRPGATREEIEAAARAVGAYADLATLEGGFDHAVDEEGRNLTAAQRQLIALARMWLAGPDIVILDEATSSLDGPLEDRVLDAVAALGRTTITITHRDNVAQRADHVIVLDAGRVIEAGTPAALVGMGGAYDRLWDIGAGAVGTAGA